MILQHLVEPAPSGISWREPTSGTFDIPKYRFKSGEQIDILHLHYKTIGNKRYDANGRVSNAVLIMHATGGSSDQFLRDIFAGELFNAGQPLDANEYFIILRDGIGHGQSSKPSDGLRAHFPRYHYADMVCADHALLTGGLGVNHLRLVMGTSMGGMHTWMWSFLYPDFMDAAMPLACIPEQLASRSHIPRKMIIDSILDDPAYMGGDYFEQPVTGITSALWVLTWMSSIPLQWRLEAPTRDEAADFPAQRIQTALQHTDANDLRYQIAASADYNPPPMLRAIKAPLVAINSEDDKIYPPELGSVERWIRRVRRGRAVLIPTSDATRGHATHTHAALWKDELVCLLEESEV